MITKFQPEGHIMDIKCNDDKLKEIVLSCIGSYENIFSLKQLCNSVCHKLEKDDLLNKEKNVEYQGGFKLGFSVTDKIQQFVWEQIWDRKIMVDLLNDEYRYTPDKNSIRLIKVK